MSFSQTHKTTITRPGAEEIVSAATHTAGAAPNIDETITDGTNELVNWAADVSEIKALVIVVDGPCTIKTNSSSEPDNTLTFAAAGRYEWTVASRATEDVCRLDTDVTALYVTTTGAVRLQISCLMDPTP